MYYFRITYVGIDRRHFRAGHLFFDLAKVLHVRDKRVGVVRHVHAEKGRLVCDGVLRRRHCILFGGLSRARAGCGVISNITSQGGVSSVGVELKSSKSHSLSDQAHVIAHTRKYTRMFGGKLSRSKY